MVVSIRNKINDSTRSGDDHATNSSGTCHFYAFLFEFPNWNDNLHVLILTKSVQKQFKNRFWTDSFTDSLHETHVSSILHQIDLLYNIGETWQTSSEVRVTIAIMFTLATVIVFVHATCAHMYICAQDGSIIQLEASRDCLSRICLDCLVSVDTVYNVMILAQR